MLCEGFLLNAILHAVMSYFIEINFIQSSTSIRSSKFRNIFFFILLCGSSNFSTSYAQINSDCNQISLESAKTPPCMRQFQFNRELCNTVGLFLSCSHMRSLFDIHTHKSHWTWDHIFLESLISHFLSPKKYFPS